MRRALVSLNCRNAQIAWATEDTELREGAGQPEIAATLKDILNLRRLTKKPRSASRQTAVSSIRICYAWTAARSCFRTARRRRQSQFCSADSAKFGTVPAVLDSRASDCSDCASMSTVPLSTVPLSTGFARFTPSGARCALGLFAATALLLV